MAASRRFLILHGWQNRRPVQHWQWQLTEALRQAGEQVLYPQFPAPDEPSLQLWTELLTAELAQLGDGERVVIAHSLAVPLWAHAAPLLTPDQHIDRVLLVAPPSQGVLRGYPEVAAFGDVPLDAAAIRTAATKTRMVSGDNDPYCPEGARVAYAGLGLADDDIDVIPGGGHLDPDSGYGEWPAALAWCLDSSTRLTPR